MRKAASQSTYDLGVLVLLRTIRPQHSFSLINSHTSPLDDLEIFQSRDNLPFDPEDQLRYIMYNAQQLTQK